MGRHWTDPHGGIRRRVLRSRRLRRYWAVAWPIALVVFALISLLVVAASMAGDVR